MIDEIALHGMQVVLAGQAADSMNLGIGDAVRRNDAGMLGRPVHQYRAGTAVTGVATLLDLDVPMFAQKGA
ncbi:Uncharacterised protein [Mycobacteroides abscessus subsp. abscessus]|nr:Uncharacterised protein [Mycobacteroides abscessus subsp. abscessus]SIK17839.1 Uncharacterised protein [Mycobacteroides abscessus subsp. abscessus]